MLWFGGDYNPEQWPTEVWREDWRLMKEAGVNLVSIGIFSWAMLEPEEGRFEFDWLDEVMAGLHAAGVAVDLATATASPPPWLTHRYPEVLPVTETGVRLSAGSRQQYCPSSPVYRRLAARLVTAIAERYADHPAVVMWHINNEYGCHVARCYCEASAAAFRDWLRARYGSIDALNHAWGTTFWSQVYTCFSELQPPRATPASMNPTQLLDFDRFSSDALLELYRAEAAIVRAATPQLPITTNFMGFFKGADYWAWAKEVDVVSNDSYPDPVDPSGPARNAMTHDLMRSLRSSPWLLMEQSTSAVYWRERNAPKAPGQMSVWSMQAVARGADGILFFQWRQSESGAEKFHSGMLPHSGTSSRVWREVVSLGTSLLDLAEVKGGDVKARVGIVMDWDSWWSIEQGGLPARLDYVEGIFAWYSTLYERDVMVDFVRADEDLSDYDAVLVPSLFCAPSAALRNLADYADQGGHLLVTYQTGITDETARITSGGYLGPLQSALGIHVDEFAPPASPDHYGRGAVAPPPLQLSGSIEGEATIWAEWVIPEEAHVLATFAGGVVDGHPAITRRGTAWYCATLPGEEARATLLEQILASAGVPAATPDALTETVVRGAHRFTIDHRNQATTVERKRVD